jgi:hypothetical protein
MRRFELALLISLLAGTVACDEEGECPPILGTRFSIMVTDATTAEPLCNAEVRVQVDEIDYRIGPGIDSGSGIFRSQPDGTCSYIALNGKSGAEHLVTVTAPGYHPLSLRIVAPERECALGDNVEARLVKE